MVEHPMKDETKQKNNDNNKILSTDTEPLSEDH